jgi:hypothetical protein
MLLESYAQLAADASAKQTARAKARQRITTLLGESSNWTSALSRR